MQFRVRLLQVRDRKAQVTFGRGHGALYHGMNRSDRREDIVQADEYLKLPGKRANKRRSAS